MAPALLIDSRIGRIPLKPACLIDYFVSAFRASIRNRGCSRGTTRCKPGYDVVIIGAGGHGLAAAYYLARDHGIRNVAVLEKGYIGGGNTGRNTTIIRSNYLTPEGVKFYDESVRLWQDLAEDFDLNLFYSTRGHYTLAHTDSAMRTMRWRAEVNKHLRRAVPRRSTPPS